MESHRPYTRVLCANRGGALFLRQDCKLNETAIDPATLGFIPRVVFRDVQREALVDPGAELSVAASCDNSEVVSSGGYSTDPSAGLRVTLNTPFFDGQNSGWRVDFLNNNQAAANVSVIVTVSCIQGKGASE